MSRVDVYIHRSVIRDEEKKIFGSAQEARDYLVSRGFPSFRKGMTTGIITAPDGRKARLSMGLLSKTGQSSQGAGASWGYVVVVE